jgi:hypothetical protein
MHKINYTVILPVHKIDELYTELLINSVGSIQDFHNDVLLTIVCPKDIKSEIEKIDLGQKLQITYLENKGQTDFCSQVNLGVENCNTEWFTILEIDDEFRPNWLKSVNEYTEENKDADVFLSIVKDVNVNGEFISFTNESVWAYGFSDSQGNLDNEVLLEYENYQTSGGLYRTKVMKEQGFFKDNVKLTFSHELLLRLTHNNIKIMTIPKIGYQHVNFREDSLFFNLKNDENSKLTEDEVKFWMDTAKKEFFFKNKRDVTYTKA